MWHHEIEVAVDPRRGGGASKFLFAAILLSVAYLALSEAALDRRVLSQDHAVHAWLEPIRHGRLQLPMETVSFLGEPAGLIPLIGIASLALALIDRLWAALLPVLMAGSGVLQYVTKWAADRPRPNAAPWGFPSGHVLCLTVFFGVVAYLIATTGHGRRRLRVLATSGCGAMVVAVAFSRMYLDMHWLSDVVGGLAVGAAYLLAALWAIQVCAPRRAVVSSASSRRGP